MKQRNEDKLIQLAFGELNAEERVILESEVEGDAVARQAVSSYAAMKLDLKKLPVPPCQISVERIRDAILDGGLTAKPAPQSSWWKLAWMPVAAALIAVAGMQILTFANKPDATTVGMTTLGGNSITKNPSSEPLIDFQPNINSFDPLPTIQTAPDEKIAAATNANVRRVRPSTVASRGRSVRGSLSAVSKATQAVAAATAGITQLPSANTNRGTSLMTAPAAMKSSTFESGSPSVGIVLIGSERDSNTGANRAVEIRDTSNVVIGG